jgi:carbamate kinase
MISTILIAIRRNSFIRADQRETIHEQIENATTAYLYVTKLIVQSFSIILTHGNRHKVRAHLTCSEPTSSRVYMLSLDINDTSTNGILFVWLFLLGFQNPDCYYISFSI